MKLQGTRKSYPKSNAIERDLDVEKQVQDGKVQENNGLNESNLLREYFYK